MIVSCIINNSVVKSFVVVGRIEDLTKLHSITGGKLKYPNSLEIPPNKIRVRDLLSYSGDIRFTEEAEYFTDFVIKQHLNKVEITDFGRDKTQFIKKFSNSGNLIVLTEPYLLRTWHNILGEDNSAIIVDKINSNKRIYVSTPEIFMNLSPSDKNEIGCVLIDEFVEVNRRNNCNDLRKSMQGKEFILLRTEESLKSRENLFYSLFLCFPYDFPCRDDFYNEIQLESGGSDFYRNVKKEYFNEEPVQYMTTQFQTGITKRHLKELNGIKENVGIDSPLALMNFVASVNKCTLSDGSIYRPKLRPLIDLVKSLITNHNASSICITSDIPGFRADLTSGLDAYNLKPVSLNDDSINIINYMDRFYDKGRNILITPPNHNLFDMYQFEYIILTDCSTDTLRLAHFLTDRGNTFIYCVTDKTIDVDSWEEYSV